MSARVSRLLCHITINDDLMKFINDEWIDALIIKIPGRNWNVDALRSRIATLWKLRGSVEMLDVGPNLFIVWNLEQAKREEILTIGPWKVAGQFMSIRKWFPEFDPSTYVDTAITWVRVQNLPPQFYRESILLQIACGLGEPIKTDANIFWKERGRFARICI